MSDEVLSAFLEGKVCLRGQSRHSLQTKTLFSEHSLDNSDPSVLDVTFKIEESDSETECGRFDTILDLIEPNDHGWNDSWSSLSVAEFEDQVLEYIRNIFDSILKGSRRRGVRGAKDGGCEPSPVGQTTKKTVQPKRREPQRLALGSEDDFPSLGSLNLMDRKGPDVAKVSSLEARIASPSGRGHFDDVLNGSSQRTLQKQKSSKKRIVPTAIESAQVDEKFMSLGSGDMALEAHLPARVMSVRTKSAGSTCGGVMRQTKKDGAGSCPILEEDAMQGDSCSRTPVQSRHGESEEVNLYSSRFQNSGMDVLSPISLDSPLMRERQEMLFSDVEEDVVRKESFNHRLPDRLLRLSTLHARLLECSSRIFITSEITLLLEILAVDPTYRVEGGDDVVASGIDAVNYAAASLVGSGNLVRSLGLKVLRDLSIYLKMISPKVESEHVWALRKLVSSALRSQEPLLLLQSPSSGNVQNTGCLTGHTGLNIFLNDNMGSVSRNADEQRKLSNRESFRDSWFKLMKEAVSRSSSLHSLEPRGQKDEQAHMISEERQGDLIALKLMQKESGHLLRALRIDNYDSFAELFTAAVLQAAATGETLMDEELTGIAKQNVSRFHSLNKRFQINEAGKGPFLSKNDGNIVPRKQAKEGSSFMKKGQVDQTAERALRISSEFSKSLRPFILFLEATDSHRLDISLSKAMREKLTSLLQSPAEGRTSLGDAPLLSVDDLCISTTALSGFLGYFSFTKGQECSGTMSPIMDQLQTKGDFDGSHQVDVLFALQRCITPPDDETDSSGNLFRFIPWICRYLKFLSWRKDVAESKYFGRVFGILRSIRRHEALQPKSVAFDNIAPLCLRAMLDDLVWNLGPFMDASEDGEIPPPQAFPGYYAGLDSAMRQDIRWASASLGHRYIDMTCPDLSYVESIFSVKSLSCASSQAFKTVKKIRPTVPSHQHLNSKTKSPLVQVSDGSKSSRPTSKKDQILKELERVFLDQYSTTAQITDVKLRDFVAWCSDAVARQGISSGLEMASQISDKATLKNISDFIEDYAREIPAMSEGSGMSSAKIERQKIQLACRSMEGSFQLQYYRSIENPCMVEMENKIKHLAKTSSQILLPNSWGNHVKMTAAAIIARRAEAAASRQLLTELKKVSLAVVKAEIEKSISTFQTNKSK